MGMSNYHLPIQDGQEYIHQKGSYRVFRGGLSQSTCISQRILSKYASTDLSSQNIGVRLVRERVIQPANTPL